MTCIHAVGLASLAYDSKRPEVMEMARCQYSHALRTTNAALQTPKRAILDETLASVMLLGLFEVVAHESEEPSDKWASHVNGALTLLVHRGPQQFKSALGRALFMQISSSIRVSCVQQMLRIPSSLIALTTQASPFLDSDNPVSRFSAITEAFTDLRTAIETGRITEPTAVVRFAREVDNQALTLSSEMPLDWAYDVAYTNRGGDEVFGNKYHIYKDHRTAQMWNTIRMTRLLLNQMIHEHLIKVASLNKSYDNTLDFSSLCDHVAKVARDMATEILASVPQFTRFSPGGSTTLFSPTVASSCFLIWPLEVAGTSSLSTEPMRLYVINRLRYMGNQMNVRQALGVVEKLEQGILSQDW
jgi:Fungal specific transcription factor domain